MTLSQCWAVLALSFAILAAEADYFVAFSGTCAFLMMYYRRQG